VNHGIAVEAAGGHDVHGARVVGGFDQGCANGQGVAADKRVGHVLGLAVTGWLMVNSRQRAGAQKRLA